jgi:hypothetical protein
MDVNMRGNGLKIRGTAVALKGILIITPISDTLMRGRLMEKGYTNGETEKFMTASGNKDLSMVTVCGQVRTDVTHI